MSSYWIFSSGWRNERHSQRNKKAGKESKDRLHGLQTQIQLLISYLKIHGVLDHWFARVSSRKIFCIVWGNEVEGITGNYSREGLL